MNINKLDLNLLIVLKQLLEEKHVSNTALTLGISQPSISRSLAKLRALFDDPLLIRMSGGYELTPKAESIYQDLNSILNNVELLVNKQSFDHGCQRRLQFQDKFDRTIVQFTATYKQCMYLIVDTLTFLCIVN